MDRALNDEALELVAYMVSSARGLVDENRMYGPLRLLDAAGRLIAFVDGKDITDGFLLRTRALIDSRKHEAATDPEAFVGFLDELVLSLAGELERRGK
jgi:hypothetical protein